MQGPLPQSEVWGESQQVPLLQAPPQHSSPEPQSESALQPEHAPPLQAWPEGQSALAQQLPAAQRPAQHSEPSPHSLSVRQSRQPSAPHTCPGAHVAGSHFFAEVPASGWPVLLVHPASAQSSGTTHVQRRLFMRTSSGDCGAPAPWSGGLYGPGAAGRQPRGFPVRPTA